jgi:hypothetical protein
VVSEVAQGLVFSLEFLSSSSVSLCCCNSTNAPESFKSSALSKIVGHWMEKKFHCLVFKGIVRRVRKCTLVQALRLCTDRTVKCTVVQTLRFCTGRAVTCTLVQALRLCTGRTVKCTLVQALTLCTGRTVKCTLVQALMLCTGRTAYRGSRGAALPFHVHGMEAGSLEAFAASRLPAGNIVGALYHKL